MLIPIREDAWLLLNQYTKSQGLIKHALAVEAAMRYYAAKYGEEEELWGVTGLIHDFDYEQHPTLDEHPMAGVAILEGMDWPQEIIEAVAAHGTHLDVPRTSRMAKTLFAVDELTGLLVACALVRPDKCIHNLEVRSVRKKWKDKAFARGVNREDIELGAAELGVDLNEHIACVIEALKQVAGELGLAGT
ncbi:MAG: HAD family hydrolase [Chloroflexi bacterium RBG_13_56_8]|nr:MAG: HAD family hydrolase [Chloroflexi bacterium RBG_13_56_8]